MGRGPGVGAGTGSPSLSPPSRPSLKHPAPTSLTSKEMGGNRLDLGKLLLTLMLRLAACPEARQWCGGVSFCSGWRGRGWGPGMSLWLLVAWWPRARRGSLLLGWGSCAVGVVGLFLEVGESRVPAGRARGRDTSQPKASPESPAVLSGAALLGLWGFRGGCPPGDTASHHTTPPGPSSLQQAARRAKKGPRLLQLPRGSPKPLLTNP